MTFPLRILLEIKTKIHTLKLPVIIHHQTQKQKAMQRQKSAGVRRCQRVNTNCKADLTWIKLSSRRTDQITENNLQEMVAWLFSAVFVKAKKQRALNTDWEKNCYCRHEPDLKIIHHEKLLRLRWCLHDTGMNFIPERLAWFVSRLHGRSHSGMKML